MANPVCDNCNSGLGTDDGYLLTTADVVTSAENWKWMLKTDPTMRMSLSMATDEGERIMCLHDYINALAALDTPWMVCDKCVLRFSVDRNATKGAAAEWRRTGKPSGGFGLCTLEIQGQTKVVKIRNQQQFLAARKTAYEAYTSLSERAG